MVEIRKWGVHIEEIFHERGPPSDKPLFVGVTVAVIRNPLAGSYVQDVVPFMKELHEIGAELAKRLVEAIGGKECVEAYGKGAIVGEDGELEHGALWHEAGGWPLRAELGNPRAIVPASKTVASLGSRLMIPLGHIHAAYVRSHFNTAELTVWDAPRRDEIVLGLAAATGPRISARAGGLQVDEISVFDGQR